MMANASLEKAMKLAVATGLRSMLGPALMARATNRPDRKNWALAAVGELVADKLPFTPSRDMLVPLIVRGIAGYWVTQKCMEDEGVEEPLTPFLGAAVAMGVAAAAPKIRKTLHWTMGIPDPILGLFEDYLALRLGTEAVGISLDDAAHAGRETIDDLASRVQEAIPSSSSSSSSWPHHQSVGAGSM